ncbi:MAG TPA: competence/damage-inducible protein A [Candidatus Acidoferrum sp.]|nr:competence/damage-inducible protein A [Candidatus Acidoferrum sp.]
MLAEILTFGDELCRGEIVDTNSSWLAAELWDLEVTCAWMTSCRDVAEDMRLALRQACARADVVVCSGGLGPTEDDLTVDVVAELVGTQPETHQPSLARMEARYAAASYRPTANTLRQVRVPGGARVHDNPVGAAPGFEVALDRVPVFCLPGVPRELKAIVEASLRARLLELRGAGERIARRTYRVFGRGESQIATALDGVLGAAPGATLHYQVAFPETLVKVVVRDPDPAAAAERLAALDRAVRGRLGDWCYGEGTDSLAAALGRALVARGLTLATAESCTGGMAGGLITAVAGSSRYYLGGAVCYANQEKVRQLGVDPATIERHGAVSEECAREMAAGMRERIGADIAVAVTGVAGPDGGTAEKPVGTVWIAVAGPGDAMRTKHFVWPGARDAVRTLAAYWALAMVLRAIAGSGSESGSGTGSSTGSGTGSGSR